MSSKPETSIASSLSAAERTALEKIVEQFRKRDRGNIAEATVRIKSLWGLYLMALQAESDALISPKQKKQTGATVTGRRSILRILKDHIGRTPTAEDLIASFKPEIEIDELIVGLVRRDLEVVGQKAKRRTRTEVLEDKIRKLQQQSLKSKRTSKKHASKKKGSKK